MYMCVKTISASAKTMRLIKVGYGRAVLWYAPIIDCFIIDTGS
jgi:hypothetical protein